MTKTRAKMLRLAAAVALSASLVACGGGASTWDGDAIGGNGVNVNKVSLCQGTGFHPWYGYYPTYNPC